MESKIAAYLPGWEVVRKLGEGSFGAVYEISRNNFGMVERAAVKVLTIPQKRSEIDSLYSEGYDVNSISKRFQSYKEEIVREYSTMALLKGCANIVHCDDHVEIPHDDGIGWDILIRMELLKPLNTTFGSQVDELQIIKLGKDISNALIQCRRKGILHRDIKPQNIFVAEDGSFKLGDFGIAKVMEGTMGGTRIGTFGYMAPEVYLGQPYGVGADIYSLGLVLYWLLNNRRLPFLPLPPQVPTAADEENARRLRFTGNAIPAPVHGSPRLKALVLKACAYDPRERFTSPEALYQALAALEAGYAVNLGYAEDEERTQRAQANGFMDPAPDLPLEKPRQNSLQQDQKKKKKGIGGFLAAVCLLLVLGLASFIGYQFLMGRDNASGDKEKDTHSSANSSGKPIYSISAGYEHTVGLRTDGTVAAAGANDEGQCDVEDWEDIIAVCAGARHTVGLQDDGSVIATGDNDDGQCDVEDWEDIIAICAGTYHTVGLREDGTVVAAGDNKHSQCDVEDWENIIAVSAGKDFTVGLTESGSVLVAGDEDDYATSHWENIVKISAGFDHIAVLNAEGTASATGSNSDGQLEVADWEGILQQISAGDGFTLALKADGTVICTDPELDVEDWDHIVAIYAGRRHAVGLKSDGTVVATGGNDEGQCDVEDWVEPSEIKDPDDPIPSDSSTDESGEGTEPPTSENQETSVPSIETMPPETTPPETLPPETKPEETNPPIQATEPQETEDTSVRIGIGHVHTAVLKENGTVAATGDNSYGQCNVSSWTNIVAVSCGEYFTLGLKSDGTVVTAGDNTYGQCNVSSWTNIVAIAAGEYHAVGLKADGTLVAAGWNKNKQCGVSSLRAGSVLDLAAGCYHTVVVYADGTAAAVGGNEFGQCNVTGWTNLIAADAGTEHTVALRSDGTVVATGRNVEGQCNVSSWTDIVAISAGDYYTLGLKSDGTVVSTGRNTNGETQVSGWKDIVAICGGNRHTVALKKDGTLVAVGLNDKGQCNVSYLLP